ncbi:MAG: hypothetical protein MJ086_04645 [Lachnospiraceae bacterium]|nr:hypothetical protein [Lachnospiraceae bacterium]
MRKVDLKMSKNRKRTIWQRAVAVLAAVVVFATTYALILPAIAWEDQCVCEIEEHIHDESCYTVDDDGIEVLTCELQEHEHTAECFDAAPAMDDGLACEQIEHVHDENCYFSDGTLSCTIPEHTHGDECLAVSAPEVVEEPKVEAKSVAMAKVPARASPNGTTSILVVAGSDFQDPNTSPSNGQYSGAAHNYNTQNARISAILNQIKTFYSSYNNSSYDAYAFFAGGDYGFDSNLSAENTNTGIAQIKGAVEAVFSNLQQELFVQGNHDNSASSGNWTTSGSYDTDYYGAFLISEDDFPAKTGTPKAATLTALETYLAGRVQNNPNQPVFILTHVPLHFDLRTVAEGDGMYGKRLFDIVSAYGDDLNIIFLYGHNHAHGDDDYIGGSANFYTKGDTIKVATDGSRSSYTTETLNFTYMNYGYTGYYWEKWVTSNSAVQSLPACNADSTLTMTSFLITGNSVEIRRWDESGQHVLKAAGAQSNGDHVSGSWNTTLGFDTSVVDSPVTVQKASTPTYQTNTKTYNNVSITASATSDWDVTISAASNSNTTVEAYKSNHPTEVGDYSVYSIEKTTGSIESGTNYTIEFPDEGKYDQVAFISDGSLSTSGITVQHANGKITVTTPHLSDWVAYALPDDDQPSGDDPAMNTVTKNNVSVTRVGIDTLVVNTNPTITPSTEGITDITKYALSFNGSGDAVIELPFNSTTQDTVWMVSGNSLVQVDVEIVNGKAVINAANLSDSASMTFVAGKAPATEAAGLPAGTYWVKCASTSDINTQNSTPHMIIYNNNGTNYAVDMKTAGDASTATSVTITDKGKYNNETVYSITGASNTAQWTFSGQTSGKIKNVKNNSYLDPATATTLSDNQNVSISSTNGLFTLSRKRNGTTRYLSFNSSDEKFEHASSSAGMAIYKQVTVQPQNPPKLQVKNTYITADGYPDNVTALTFKLSAGTTEQYNNASAVTDLAYKVYDSNGALTGSKRLTSDGTFTLKSGEYAEFEGLDSTKNYFVTELANPAVEEVVSGKVDGRDTTPSDASGNKYLRIKKANNETGTIEFTSRLVEKNHPLTVTFNITGNTAYISNDAPFSLHILDSDGNPAVYESYDIIINGETFAENVPYDEENAPLGIRLRNGYTIRIKGLENGNYTVVEDLTSDNYSQFIGVTEKIGSGDETDKNVAQSIATSINYQGTSQTDVVYTNKLSNTYTITFDYGDGTFETRTTGEDGKLTGTMPTKDREGYIFHDWHTRPNQGGVIIRETDYNNYPFTQNQTLYAHWEKVEDVIGRDANFEKSINSSKAYENGVENLFDIKLNADLPSNKTMGVVLTFDVSSSMNQFCAICGKDSGSHNTNSTTGFDGSSVSDSYTSAVDPTTGQRHSYLSRFEVMQEAAENFVRELYAAIPEKGIEHCYIEVVRFGQYAEFPTENLTLDLGTLNPNRADDLDTLVKTSGSRTDGIIGTAGNSKISGTNISYGLKTSEKALEKMPGRGVQMANTYVLLMSDGAPTTDNKTMVDGYDDAESQYYIDDAALNEDFMNKWKENWSGYNHYQWRGEDQNYLVKKANAGSATSTNKVFSLKSIFGVPYYADEIHDLGSHLYSVVMGHNLDNNKWDTANNYRYVTAIGIENADYVASFSDVAMRADNKTSKAEILADLDVFYDTLISAAEANAKNAVVTDPMSEDVEFVGFEDENGNLVTDNSGNPVYSYHNAIYDSTTRSITWYPGEQDADDIPDGEYLQLTYRVRLKNEQTGFKDYAETGASYYTNGQTSMNYDLVFEDEVSNKTKYAELPVVHGWLGELSFVKIGGLTPELSKPLAGAKFKLEHDAANCTECLSLPASERPTIPDYTATSDTDGVVFFGIPSGHMYKLTETETRNGYTRTTASYGVHVTFDKVIVTAPEGDTYWTETLKADGTVDKRTMYNPEEPKTLPETGGVGLLPIYAIGAVLTTGSVLAYILQKRRRRKMN